jgi:hypothetical protein
VQETQVPEQVDDLLLAEVAAAGRPVCGQALSPERLLVPLGIRAGGEEHDDLAGLGLAGVDELADPRRDPASLARPPVLVRSGEARLVRDEQLHGMPEDRIGKLGRRGERLVVVAELVGEQMVDGGQHLRPGAVVPRQGVQARRPLTPLAEDFEVGVPEAVDRLELVADGEDLAVVRMRDQVDQLALQTVRVLELVDHHSAEAEPGRFPHRVVVAQQVSCSELEVLEVDDRLASLRRRIRLAEALEQLLQELTVVGRELFEGGPLGRLPRVLERGSASPFARERREVDKAFGSRAVPENVEQLRGVPPLGRRRARVVRESLRLTTQRPHRVARARALAELENEVASGRAQRLVHACQHSPQAVRPIRREKPQALRIAARAELLQRSVEGLTAEHRRTGVLELAEPRVEAGRERMGAEQSGAEPVNRGDPGTVELAREVRSAALTKGRTDSRPQLTGGLAGVRDHEDRLDVDAPLADGADEALDENRRLARSGAGGDEDRPVLLDGRDLLLVEPCDRLHDRHARATRQIGHRSHQGGHPSPFGS